MAMLKCYLSSSKGNLYEVSDGKTRVLLECGVSFKNLQQLAGFRTGSWAGCLITHEHGDHAKAAKKLAERGVAIYATSGTLEALGLENSHKARPLEYMKPVKIGSLTVMAFRTIHNAAEPCGYVITSERTEQSLMFATDTYKIPYRFVGLTEIAVEANHSEKMIDDSLPEVVLNRIRHSHLSLESCLEFLRAQDLSRLEKLTLVHLSRERASAEEFRRVIEEELKIPVNIA